MAKVTFDVGDQFKFRYISEGERCVGFGIVIPNNMSVVIRGEGGRIPRNIIREAVPEDAWPVDKERTGMAYEVKFALDAIGTALIG